MDISSLTKLSKKELIELFNANLVNCRIWLSERGEQSLILGIVLGILVAIFFKVVIGAFVLALVLSLLMWHLAEDEPIGSSIGEESSEREETASKDVASDPESKDDGSEATTLETNEEVIAIETAEDESNEEIDIQNNSGSKIENVAESQVIEEVQTIENDKEQEHAESAEDEKPAKKESSGKKKVTQSIDIELE